MPSVANMTIDMRRSKLKRDEVALLAGEIKKPSWASRNEGIHERVSFEDTIWGFDLAGGAFYNTPLRVTLVKQDSRAEKAHIRPGDKLLKINDIDTSTLTIQEAHDLIVKSGIHIKLTVTAPDDDEDAYFCYQDPVEQEIDRKRRELEEKVKKREARAKILSSRFSLQWPWVTERKIIYRDSNCFMVPSKYESKHREKYPPLPVLRREDDVIRIPTITSTKPKNNELIENLEDNEAQDNIVENNPTEEKEEQEDFLQAMRRLLLK